MQYEWSNINDIAIELSEKFPDIDPQWISFPDLHKKITELDNFIGDPNKCEYMLSISIVRSKDIPAVTHVDNTARVQIIDFDEEEMDNELCNLLQNIKQKSFAPVLVNTSFNCANEPIVETIEDAARSFIKMNFDYLWTDEGLFTIK